MLRTLLLELERRKKEEQQRMTIILVGVSIGFAMLIHRMDQLKVELRMRCGPK